MPHEWLFERWCPRYSPSRLAFHPTSFAQISPRPGVVYGVCLFSLTGDLGIWGEKPSKAPKPMKNWLWQKWRLSLFLLRWSMISFCWLVNVLVWFLAASRPSLLETSAAKPWTLPPKVDNSLQVSWNSDSNAQAKSHGSFSQAERTKRSNPLQTFHHIMCIYIYMLPPPPGTYFSGGACVGKSRWDIHFASWRRWEDDIEAEERGMTWMLLAI